MEAASVGGSLSGRADTTDSGASHGSRLELRAEWDWEERCAYLRVVGTGLSVLSLELIVYAILV